MRLFTCFFQYIYIFFYNFRSSKVLKFIIIKQPLPMSSGGDACCLDIGLRHMLATPFGSMVLLSANYTGHVRALFLIN